MLKVMGLKGTNTLLVRYFTALAVGLPSYIYWTSQSKDIQVAHHVWTAEARGIFLSNAWFFLMWVLGYPASPFCTTFRTQKLVFAINFYFLWWKRSGNINSSWVDWLGNWVNDNGNRMLGWSRGWPREAKGEYDSCKWSYWWIVLNNCPNTSKTSCPKLCCFV